MSSISNHKTHESHGATGPEAFKQAIRDQLSPGGIAAIIATLQPATMQRAPTEDAQRGLDELEWFANTLIEVLGVDEYQRRACKPKRPRASRRVVPAA